MTELWHADRTKTRSARHGPVASKGVDVFLDPLKGHALVLWPIREQTMRRDETRDTHTCARLLQIDGAALRGSL